jgi:hypothetical protein
VKERGEIKQRRKMLNERQKKEKARKKRWTKKWEKVWEEQT